MPRLLILATLAVACGASHRVAPAALHAASRTPDTEPAAVGQAVPSIPRAQDSAAAQPSLDDDESEDLDSELVTDEVRGLYGLRVQVSWMTLTGTTHVASALTIETPGGKLELAQPAEDARLEDVPPEDQDTGRVLPLIDRVLELGPGRWVLLGWSSFGEGMMTNHAWLIVDRGGPRIADELSWSTSRSFAGLALDVGAGAVRVGVPVPTKPRRRGGDDEPHRLSDWMLTHGKRDLGIDDVWRLPATRQHVMSLAAFHTPPTGASPAEQGWSGRFVWFAANGERFVRSAKP